MPEEKKLSALTLPALRAKMGDRVYYIACMRLGDLRDRVSRVSEIPGAHQSKTLSKLIQREIEEGHATKIAAYLLQPDNDERFFNGLVIGVYGGSPEWYELDVRGNREFPEGPGENTEGIVGYLRLEGTEKLFAIDGQHRMAGIKKALEKRPDLTTDEVSVLFVGHKTTQEGLQRTRRLFTTLNKYAKAVSPMEKIALDEDDAIAVTVRRLMEEYPLLKDRLSLAKTRSLSTSDTRSLTTVETLYNALDFYLKPTSARGWAAYLRQRPNDEELDSFYERAVELWEAIKAHCPELRTFAEAQEVEIASAPYRNKDGGHLLFRPVGLDIIFRTIRYRKNEGLSTEGAVAAVFQAPMNLSDELWYQILWSPSLNRMVNSPNKTVATALMLKQAGGQLATMRRGEVWLERELASYQP
ncbi:DNA sulfur modification protein DndB [Armatimonas rosea]|uniref:DNA sulfur modification protein DndB n=1 Tax=Armatimonas rosea TaxID=685828 RepID=A0A7W9SR85_ARMRO|nr:DNA sulfur modification protein DndB [Armatimonas rosea]MBB6050768.1 DNA sulfur modification protein DndB [Armatimonas rosea]